MITKRTRAARKGWAKRYQNQIKRNLESSKLLDTSQIDSVLEVLTENNRKQGLSLTTKPNLARLKRFANASPDKLDKMITNRVKYMVTDRKREFSLQVNSKLNKTKSSLAISFYNNVDEFYLEFKDEFTHIYNNVKKEDQSAHIANLWEGSIAQENKIKAQEMVSEKLSSIPELADLAIFKY